LGLRPNRLGIAFFLVVLTAVLLGIGNWIDAKAVGGAAAEALHERGAAPWLSDLPWRCFVGGPRELVRHWPVSTLVIGPVLVFAWTIGLGALARMAAV